LLNNKFFYYSQRWATAQELPPIVLYIHMAFIHNSDLTKELVKGIALQQTRDQIPNQLAEKVVPVMEVNPKLLRVCNIVRGVASSATGSVTIYAIPADRDFFLTACALAIEYDAICDNSSTYIEVNIDGVTSGTNPILFSHITGNAGSRQMSFSFPVPIKVKSGTNIVMSGTKTAGAFNKVANIVGYTVENVNA
jgi:hypothetical protein